MCAGKNLWIGVRAHYTNVMAQVLKRCVSKKYFKKPLHGRYENMSNNDNEIIYIDVPTAEPGFRFGKLAMTSTRIIHLGYSWPKRLVSSALSIGCCLLIVFFIWPELFQPFLSSLFNANVRNIINHELTGVFVSLPPGLLIFQKLLYTTNPDVLVFQANNGSYKVTRESKGIRIYTSNSEQPTKIRLSDKVAESFVAEYKALSTRAE